MIGRLLSPPSTTRPCRVKLQARPSRSAGVRAARLAIVVLVLAAAGCAAPGDGPASDPSASPPMPWGIDRCAFVIAAVPVDPAALAAFVPDGFTLRPGRLSALPAGPSATIELDAYRCASGRWGDAEIADMAYGSHYVAVDPPADLREEGYGAYFLKWDVLVADDAARARLAAAGVPAHAGDALVEIDETLGTVRAALGFQGGGGFTLEGAMGSPGPPGGTLPFMEFTPLAGGGIATWHARLHDAEVASGTGVVSLPPESWVREIVGAERAPATFIAGVWNVDEADVRTPEGASP